MGESYINNIEQEDFTQNLEIVPPAVDLLIKEKPNSPIGEEVINDPVVKEQIKQRQLLSEKLGNYFKHVLDKNMTASEAVERGLIKPQDLSELYQEFSRFLEMDENNYRIILYLPFEILPNLADSNESANQFIQSYLKAWRQLLNESDVRANFVDGDIPEPQMTDNLPPHVRKAAHLIPILVQKGLISVDEVIGMFQDCDDDILKHSILDTFPVLLDLNLISTDKFTRVTSLMPEYSKKITDPNETKYYSNIEDLIEDFRANYPESDHIETNASQIVEARQKWDRQEELNKYLTRYAKSLSNMIKSGTVGSAEIIKFIQDEELALMIIEAVHMTVETTSDLDQAQILSSNFENILQSLWVYENRYNDLANLQLSKTTYLGMMI